MHSVLLEQTICVNKEERVCLPSPTITLISGKKCYNVGMNLNAPLQVLRVLHPSNLRQHPIMHDPVSLVALGLSLLLNILTLAVMVVRVHQVDYPVPVHYLSLIGFDQVGPWYQNYRIAAFGFMATLINGLLAGQSFQRNRLTSFFLLIGSVAVGLLCLVIGSEFAAII